MQHKALWGLLILNLLATAGVGAYVYTSQAKAPAQDAAAAGIDGSIKTWVEANPQVIVESVQKLMSGQQEQNNAQSLEKVKANHDFLYNDARHPVLGNKDGDVTVVEFLDYNCGYCKKAYGPVMELIEKDPNVKVVLIEIPILAESSELAARWALAAHDQGQYGAFHKALMENHAPISEETLTSMAEAAGLNVAEIKAKADSEDVKKAVAENLAKSQEIGVNGTPGFIIGNEIIRGYIEYPEMKAAVDKARSHKE